MRDERIQALIDLQTIVTRKTTLIRNHESVPARLEELQAIIQEARDNLIRARRAVKENEDLIKKSQKEIETGEEKLTDLQAKLNQVKTTREYEGRQREVQHQRARLSELAEIIEKAQAETESIKQTAVDAKEKYEEVSARYAGEIEELEKESQRFEEELEKLQEEEQEARRKVPSDLLERVEKLFRSRNGIGVVPVNDGSCGGCGIQVSPQTIQVAKRGLDLIQCDRCSSYLYWDEELD